MGNSASSQNPTKSPKPLTDKRHGADNEGHIRVQQPSVQPNTSSSAPFQLYSTKATTTTASHTVGESASNFAPMAYQQNTESSGWRNIPSVTSNTCRTCATIPIETANSSPRSVPGRAGWISNTGGGSSPLSSTLPNQKRSHRQSISGPYYRARGMSVNQQQDDNLSSSPQGLQFQQMQINPPQSGVPTVITWSQGGDNVHVIGTFNHWKHSIKLVKSTHDFNTVLKLAPGTHHLKFIVDDEWRCSNDMETATDPDGNLVNYLQVVENDETYTGQDDNQDNDDDYTSIIPTDLLSDIPPPSLPPHLESVVLNTAIELDDNSILPVPNHVALNHLFARSVKDQVMALATTTRYRKKYVTTMYYKPV